MKLFSYIVARDYGFAPNPFYGFCTLATCKPHVRDKAVVGDWIVGTGAAKKYKYSGRLIYAMQVSEVMDFDTYWNDPRFVCKRPVLNGSLKQLYGDNIYHKRENVWIQEDSHHSLDSGVLNTGNLRQDTQKNRVLIGSRFVYFGASAPVIPAELRPFPPTGEHLYRKIRRHQVLSTQIAQAFDQWMDSQDKFGLQGFPLEFKNHPKYRGDTH
jgi:hypothetical protein